MPDPETSCVRKVAYRTYLVAWKEMKRTQTRFNDHNIEPYECIFCGNWHLGHPSPERLERRKPLEGKRQSEVLDESERKVKAFEEYQKKNKANPPQGWDWREWEKGGS